MSDQYVSGRRAFLQMIDRMLAEDKNIKAMQECMQGLLDTHPLTFFEKVLMPLMPKDMLGLTAEDDAKNQEQHITIQFAPAPAKSVESTVVND